MLNFWQIIGTVMKLTFRKFEQNLVEYKSVFSDQIFSEIMKQADQLAVDEHFCTEAHCHC